MAEESIGQEVDALVRGTLRGITARPPLVHCLTNIVVAGFTANVLLALGASPAMVENAEEAAPFAAVSGAVLVNLGTLSNERAQAMRLAASSAREHGVPWVLDPVAVGALAHRTALAVELLEARPAVIRGNGSEIQALAAAAGVAPGGSAGGRGVDSLASSDDAVEAAGALAAARSCVVAVSGATDYITDGTRTVAVGGGHPMMTRVTGMGCALGAVIAAATAGDEDPLAAAAGASAVFAVAGEQAAAGVAGPGSFAVAFLDLLATMAGGAGPGTRS
jgi:hydroxyethylthiazole kinase